MTDNSASVLYKKLSTFLKSNYLGEFLNSYELKDYKLITGVAFLLIVISCGVLIVYTIVIFDYKVNKAPKNKTTLNIETIEYASIYSMTFKPFTFKKFKEGNKPFSFNAYLLVICLGVAFLILLCVIISLLLNKRKVPNTILLTIVCLAVAIILQIVLLNLSGKSINMVKQNVDSLNTYSCLKIYKNGDFLKKLNTGKSDTVESHTIIVECLNILKQQKSETELAKGFYTLTLYNYFNEVTSKNFDNSAGAYAIFDLKLLTDRDKCKISGYMPRTGTFIEDIGETIIRQHMPPSRTINEAMYKCDMWIAETNRLANTIYPDKAFNVFLLILVATIVINSLLVLTIYYYGIVPSTSFDDRVDLEKPEPAKPAKPAINLGDINVDFEKPEQEKPAAQPPAQATAEATATAAAEATATAAQPEPAAQPQRPAQPLFRQIPQPDKQKLKEGRPVRRRPVRGQTPYQFRQKKEPEVDEGPPNE